MPPEVTAIAVRGRWVKHTYPGSPPLPKRDPPPDNRWQRGHVVDALYLADSEQTAWAEWYRHLAERAIPPLAQMPRALWTWDVDVEVADLSSTAHLSMMGLPSPVPGHLSWPAFQEVGQQLSHAGWAGLLAPSAARPAGSRPRITGEEHNLAQAAAAEQLDEVTTSQHVRSKIGLDNPATRISMDRDYSSVCSILTGESDVYLRSSYG